MLLTEDDHIIPYICIRSLKTIKLRQGRFDNNHESVSLYFS